VTASIDLTISEEAISALAEFAAGLSHKLDHIHSPVPRVVPTAPEQFCAQDLNAY
jgi:hypothetical protein